MTRTDYYILEALEDPDILEIQSPAVIAKNLDITRSHVSRRLSEFQDYELVTKIDQGYYRITEKGRRFVHGDLSSKEI